eukprot:3686432-Pyramimonas_sp.AAC.1
MQARFGRSTVGRPDPPCAVTLYHGSSYIMYLYLGEWNPRVWDMSEVQEVSCNPMYPTSSHLKLGGALRLQSASRPNEGA